METTKININDSEYLKVELEPFKQASEYFFIGKVKASDLIKIYTVRPAKYDLAKNAEFAETFPDDDKYYSHLIEKVSSSINDDEFQRNYDPNRVSGIAKFLKEEKYPFFPNTIIANCELVNDIKEFDLDEFSSLEDFTLLQEQVPSHLSLLCFDESTSKRNLLIPYKENTILIIDGQHRLEGLKRTDSEFQENYELLIAFIIGHDRSVVAKQFYTINYNQKPVNKSLLYHLTGEFSTELDELTYLHNVVKILNELSYSPFYGRLKMLGVNPKGIDKEEARLMSLSQAFLVDSLMKTISKSAINSNYPPIFLYYYQKEELQIEIIRFLIRFFNLVKEKVPNWDNPDESLVSKGMGVGALLKSLQLIFPIIFFKDANEDPDKIKDIPKDVLLDHMSGLENVDLSKDGEFGGVGSSGSISKITKEIIRNLKISENRELDELIKYLKEGDGENEGYSTRFKNWLKKNTK